VNVAMGAPMRARFLAQIAIATILSAAPAAAQDAYDWTGFYAGFGLGGGAGIVTDLYDLSDTFSFGILGPAVDARIGANIMSGNVLLGVVVDASASHITGTGSCFTICGGTGTEPTVTVQGMGTIEGRLGLAADQSLFYATAGVGIARALAVDPVQGGSDSHLHRGVVLGGGVEHAMTENISVFAEAEIGIFEAINYALVTTPDRLSFTVGTVRLGANFHF
jgi:outer membrane immunogenic protein